MEVTKESIERSFREALIEEGFPDIDVSVDKSPDRMSETLYSVCIGTYPNSWAYTISERELMSDDPKRCVAFIATKAASEISEEFREYHSWGDKAVAFNWRERYSVSCCRCGSEVEMPPNRDLKMAESSVPVARTRGYDSFKRQKIKMALLALLRGECKPSCPRPI